MTESSNNHPDYQQLSDQQFHEMDSLSDRFDRELVNGDRPRIETFLEQTPESGKASLLAELLAIETGYRIDKGENPQLEDYVQRFPEYENVIGEVLDRESSISIQGSGTISIKVDAPPVVANFSLIEEIGRGGMGVVWLAEQEQPVKRRVALKLIKSGLASQEVIERFDAEKQALALMDHPNIARVLDAGTTNDGWPYFVMELVEGIPITQYCDDNKMSVDERLKLFVSVCKAVQHAHQKGVVHRDLKPSNVLVTVIDGEAVPKVIDFGLAKAIKKDMRLTDASMMTEFGKIVGTVQYMSPEQAELKGSETQDIDTRTDVYSLGVMLYELLTGSTPLDKELLNQNALLKILEMIREDDPPRPSNRLSSSSNLVNSEVSDLRRMQPARLQRLLQGELDWVVMKALEKDRERRYQTANDLAQDLANYLSGAPVAARPPSTWYQVQKFAKRNQGLVAALLTIGVVLLAGIAGTTYGLIRANQKTKLAVEKTKEANEERRRAVKAEELANAESKRARDSDARGKFQLAVARFDADRTTEARSILHQIPQEYCDNFEWHYCKRRFQGSDVTCYGHSSGVNKVAFTPDGKRAVSAGEAGTIRIWDTTTGREVGKLKGHEGRVLGLAISPDGAFIVSAGQNQKVNLWDRESGEIVRTMTGHTGSINCVAFHPSGERFVSASNDKTMKVWSTKTGEEIITITGHTSGINGVAYSPDGKQLVSGGGDRLIRIWDAQSGGPITKLSKHRLEVNSVAFSPDGTRIIASSYNYVSLWNSKNWQFVAECGGHAGHVRCVSFSPDGTQFATGGEDANIQLWDSQSGKKIKLLNGHTKPVWGLAFSPDASRLVSASKDKTIKIWNPHSSGVLALRGHTGHVSSVAFSSDGKQLASGGQGGVVVLRNALTFQKLFTLKGHSADADELHFSPDGKRLVSGSGDSTIRIWDTKNGTEIAVLKGHASWVRGVAFSPDGTQIASGGREGTVKLWDAKTFQELATLKGHRGDVYCVAFSPDGSFLASGGFDQTIKFWNAKSGEEIRTLKGHTGRVRSIAFGPRGERIVSGGYDMKARVWDVASGKQLSTAHIRSGIVFGVSFSPDGTRIATVGTNGVSLFDATSGKEFMNLMAGISEVAFSPDGKRLVAATPRTVEHNGTVHVWHAPQNHETRILSGHIDSLGVVTFSTDGTRIYSESASEKLVWSVSTGKQIRNATWDPPEIPILTSPDQRWFVTSESNNVVLVDLEYKNSIDEKAWRNTKASFDSPLHHEQANAAVAAKNWYAAVFQYALLLKNDPDQATFHDGLQSSFKKLKAKFEKEETSLEPYLSRVVKEVLKLPEEAVN